MEKESTAVVSAKQSVARESMDLGQVVLTDREATVLNLLADGLGTAEVGRRLYYSERTVKNILHAVTSRLHLRNRTQAVAYALRHGLI